MERCERAAKRATRGRAAHRRPERDRKNKDYALAPTSSRSDSTGALVASISMRPLK
jgi:hypothetical protein